MLRFRCGFWILLVAASAEEGVLTFEKISRFDRAAEPVDTGPLAARLPRRGFLPLTAVRLAGKLVWPSLPGFVIRAGGRPHSTADAGAVQLEIREAGPLAASACPRRGRGRSLPPATPRGGNVPQRVERET